VLVWLWAILVVSTLIAGWYWGNGMPLVVKVPAAVMFLLANLGAFPGFKDLFYSYERYREEWREQNALYPHEGRSQGAGDMSGKIKQVPLDFGGFGVNAYVIHAPEGDIIVDAGAEPEKILAATTQPVAAILVTHNHADHISALDEVRAKTGAPVHAHPTDADGAGIEDYEPLFDGQELSIAGQEIRVLHTPGHSSGSVTFVVGEDQIVGDLVLPRSVGRTDISGASWEEIEVSIRKVMPHWTASTRLYAGHGPVLSAAEEVENNPYLPPVAL